MMMMLGDDDGPLTLFACECVCLEIQLTLIFDENRIKEKRSSSWLFFEDSLYQPSIMK